MGGNERKAGWHLHQHFGKKIPIESVANVDILSSLEFNEDGRYLAVGDNGGRVILFQQEEAHTTPQQEMVFDMESESESESYKFFSEFQSHEREFDYLNSTEIQERINCIQWLPSNPDSLFLLSANDKTIKLWKVSEKCVGPVPCPILDRKNGSGGSPAPLDPPTYSIVPQNKRVYSHAHSFNINTLSALSDGETFLSADDFRINLWNLEVSNQSFNILDIKPSSMDNITEVIMSMRCHPTQCNLFVYANSRGQTTLSDLRVSAKSSPCRIFEDHATYIDPDLLDYVSPISSIRFTPGGRYFLTRDFLSVRVWDMYMEKEPVQVLPVHDCLLPQLPYHLDSDFHLDRFDVAVSPDGRSVLTGSYQNVFHIMDRVTREDVALEASRKSKLRPPQHPGGRLPPLSFENPDFGRKVTQVAWHPQQDLIALTALNVMYVFSSNQ